MSRSPTSDLCHPTSDIRHPTSDVHLLTGLLLSFAVAAGIGPGSTWYALTQNISFGALELGAWKGYPRNGTVSIDPHARAGIARNGELPVGSGAAGTFTAAADE